MVKRRAGGAAVYGVLSGDAGGAGIAEMAELLRAEGIGRFAVSEAEEAEALRKAGFVDEEILMLRSTTDREVLERLVDLNVVCTISSVDTGLALNALAENLSLIHILGVISAISAPPFGKIKVKSAKSCGKCGKVQRNRQEAH